MLILLQAGGLILVYKLQQSYIQHRMALLVRQMSTGLTTLDISKKEYQQGKRGTNEFYFNGKMYDIKSAVVSGSTVRLEVAPDTDEDDVLSKIGSVSHRENQAGGALEQLINLITQTYITPSVDMQLFVTDDVLLHYTCYRVKLLSLPTRICYPPPRAC